MSKTLLNIPQPELRRPKFAGQLPHNLVNIGLTGGIGSGKSTVAKLLRERGAAVIDLDRISHALTQADGRAMPQIIEAFGASAAMASGELNRANMREWVFGDIKAKHTLERILHPMIAQDAIEWANKMAHISGHKYLVFDIPLLAESDFWTDRLDWIVVVDCSRQTQIERVNRRSPNLIFEIIESMIDAQAQPDTRRSIANVLINNDKNEKNFLNLTTQIDILSQHAGFLKK